MLTPLPAKRPHRKGTQPKGPWQSLRQIAACLLSFGFVISGIFGLGPIHARADSHQNLPTIPCDIRLIFGTDDRGMPSVAYKLGLQIRNRTARHIAGVSVYWLDDTSKVIGNSGATCGVAGDGIGPSEAGHCETIVQQIGGTLLQKLGEDTWTEIINHELANFKKVKHCAVIGFDYHSHQPKTY